VWKIFFSASQKVEELKGKQQMLRQIEREKNEQWHEK
jgi:hypothetical protein